MLIYIDMVKTISYIDGTDLDLEISRSNDKLSMSLECVFRFARKKSSMNRLIYFMYDLDH